MDFAAKGPNGRFVVEESYYETNGKRHASPHLFLITEVEDGILLSSYEIPEGEDKSKVLYDSMKNIDYTELKKPKNLLRARVHNLKNISVDIPLNEIVEMAWVSSSDRDAQRLKLASEMGRKHIRGCHSIVKNRRDMLPSR